MGKGATSITEHNVTRLGPHMGLGWLTEGRHEENKGIEETEPS